ncbi:glycosyltransferase family 2 protein [Cohnella sp. LGH]|uniref:glycosyltransferase family 2 protein n=1 Tax=Cohnella sp. LGH TaxID=1619153 RepID=UPI001AD99DE2|nr:glycosyltransferase family 2 protein [Cohnella sp. LGH]QTH42269.1 glycosyltransferase family 2 protein [Cohnella sp. LGH]
MPKVSVVMPVYNGAQHLHESIESIQRQTFTDWEFIIINEFGSNDGSAEIVEMYAKGDKRIRLVQNDQRLGLGESLNKGIRLAEGQYIARMDADDLSHPTRFAKQVELMDANPNVAICGTYQNHFGPGINWVHRPPVKAEQTRTNLLFKCDLCHSTLMLRKKMIIDHDLFYDNTYLNEDFELWTRVLVVADIVNIPEVLGEYRHGENNITKQKKEALEIESGLIVANSLLRNLHISISQEDHELFNSWRNVFQQESDVDKRENMLERLKLILQRIWESNKRIAFYDSVSLEDTLVAKWRWAQHNVVNYVRDYCTNQLEVLRERKIYVFGAGEVGRHVTVFLQERGIRVAKVIDNYSSKQGSSFEGISICSWDDYLQEATENNFILITLLNDEEVVKQIEFAQIPKSRYASILQEASKDVTAELLSSLE